MIFLSIWKQEEAIKGNLFSVQESTYSVLLSYFYIKRKMNSIKEKAVVKRVLAKKSWRRRRRSHAIKWHRDHLLRMLKGFISPSSNVVNIKQMLSKYKYYVRIVYITCAKFIPILYPNVGPIFLSQTSWLPKSWSVKWHATRKLPIYQRTYHIIM